MSVQSYLSNIEDESRRNDCEALTRLMSKATKQGPQMWGTSIVGFGSYHYEYESGRVSFSPCRSDSVVQKKKRLPAKSLQAVSSRLLLYWRSLLCRDPLIFLLTQRYHAHECVFPIDQQTKSLL